jgi:beta-glucosidase
MANSFLAHRVCLPFEEDKVSAQLRQLSLEEKVSLLAGQGFATTAAVPRLGIPSMKVGICRFMQNR